jgi:hypothetical protein
VSVTEQSVGESAAHAQRDWAALPMWTESQWVTSRDKAEPFPF